MKTVLKIVAFIIGIAALSYIVTGLVAGLMMQFVDSPSECKILDPGVNYTVTEVDGRDIYCLSDEFEYHPWYSKKVRTLVRVDQQVLQRLEVMRGARFTVSKMILPDTENPDTYVIALPIDWSLRK